MNIPKIESNLRSLEAAGFDCSALWRELRAREVAAERRVPTEDDTRWPLTTPCSLEEHLNGGFPLTTRTAELLDRKVERAVRPFFGTAIAVGRAYVLTPAQRSVMRKWFNLIPTEAVEVVEIKLFDSAIAIPAHVVVKTQEHVDPRNRRLLNAPRKVTIDRWGQFMSECKAVETELAQQAEVDKLTARVARLLKRAGDAHVAFAVSAGTIAYEWHAVIEQKKLTDAAAIREELRTILVSRGESKLAEMVNEPNAFAGATKNEEEFSELLKALGV